MLNGQVTNRSSDGISNDLEFIDSGAPMVVNTNTRAGYELVELYPPQSINEPAANGVGGVCIGRGAPLDLRESTRPILTTFHPSSQDSPERGALSLYVFLFSRPDVNPVLASFRSPLTASSSSVRLMRQL
ncbi:hypothetical protein SUGI_1503560 [Cryptomeria japonica]|uniref:Uncharacterized protein n=1 Tax=Cryptomeria japonica TaxID=3369 RepID=A0AAD3RS37_CRYJA|nr:hypothetical protein SUGI_1503560 [Cryptomeria japonica]